MKSLLKFSFVLAAMIAFQCLATSCEDEELEDLSSTTSSATKDCSKDAKAVEYRTKLNQGCQPCGNCAILAFTKCSEPTNTTLINLYKDAVRNDEVSYGVKTCPELL